MSEAAAVVVTAPLVIGRYALFDELAAGGMATVHLGRLLGSAGFGRTVAVKRLHAHYLKDQDFLTMFMDEARIVARIRHPNVVAMVDVVQSDKGLFLVMEYVHGESLSRLMRNARQKGEMIPARIVAAVMCGVLLGLHAAHETKGNDGYLLGVVHRDVSPQNVIVGADGSARVLDFGIAKAAGRAQVTREGQIKGKLAYMAPEQIRGQVDRRTDVFAASVVLWEMLAGRRLHDGAKDVDIVTRVVKGNFPLPSQFAPDLPPVLDEIVLKGLSTSPDNRYASARELALELERKVGLASPSEVAEWVEHLAPEVLQARTNLVTAMELAAGDLVPLESNPPPAPFALTDEEEQPPPSLQQFPVDVDMSQAFAEVPSSSAVFAHSQTAPDASVPEPLAPPGLGRVAWIVVGVSAVFALIGLMLGAYAIIRGESASPAPTHPFPNVLPRPAEPVGPPSSAQPLPSSPNAAAPEAPSAKAGDGDKAALANAPAPSAPTPNLAPTSASAGGAPPLPIPTGAATAATPLVAPTVAATGAAAVAPSAGAVKPATGAATGRPGGSGRSKACDPPYSVDSAGHRHYKPECMGLD